MNDIKLSYIKNDSTGEIVAIHKKIDIISRVLGNLDTVNNYSVGDVTLDLILEEPTIFKKYIINHKMNGIYTLDNISDYYLKTVNNIKDAIRNKRLEKVSVLEVDQKEVIAGDDRILELAKRIRYRAADDKKNLKSFYYKKLNDSYIKKFESSCIFAIPYCDYISLPIWLIQKHKEKIMSLLETFKSTAFYLKLDYRNQFIPWFEYRGIVEYKEILDRFIEFKMEEIVHKIESVDVEDILMM